jgi:hypothetical protein
MSWTSVPPHATFITWMPRQIAKTGSCRARAVLTSAISNSSRPGSASTTDSCAASPYRDGATSSPPVSIKPSIPLRASSTPIDASTIRTSPPTWRIDCL